MCLKPGSIEVIRNIRNSSFNTSFRGDKQAAKSSFFSMRSELRTISYSMYILRGFNYQEARCLVSQIAAFPLSQEGCTSTFVTISSQSYHTSSTNWLHQSPNRVCRIRKWFRVQGTGIPEFRNVLGKHKLIMIGLCMFVDCDIYLHT